MCGGNFADETRFCPQDGAALVAPASADPLLGCLLDGRYRIEARLGQGGMGTVYRASHALIGRPVAVKVMRGDLAGRAEMALRFRREAILTSKLDHPCCVHVADVSPEGSAHAYLVMDLLEGEDLQRAIRRGPIPLRRAVEIAASVASALAHAHGLGVIHRDLKPENVFLHMRDGREVVKVVDFGIARSGYEETITRAGEVFGTPQYMSPEQAIDPSGVDLRSDVYSLGATLFAMLTARTPLPDEPPALMLSRVVRGEIQRHPRAVSPSVPEWLDELVARCLARAPEDRPSSASEVEEALRRGLPEMTALDPSPSNPAETPTLRIVDPRAVTRAVVEDAPRSSQRDRGTVVQAERRQLTVLVSELSNLDELTERIDIDDQHELLLGFRAACEEVIAAAGGRVARSIDSSMLAYLGYPQAHEDDAQRAVDAALEIVKRVRALQPSLSGGAPLALEARIGLHSGQVMIEDGRERDSIELVGTPPVVAARLARAAGPGEVLASAATHALLQGSFRCESRREHSVPNLSQPLASYRVLEARAFGTRFARKLTGGLVPFVGRRREVEMLEDLWQRTREGNGQVVLLSGDGGIGKSRVVEELKSRLGGDPHTVLELQCWEHRQGSALHPVIQLLERTLGFVDGDGDEARQDKIDALLRDHGMDVAATAPLFAALLSVRDVGRHPRRELGLARSRAETCAAILALILRLAERQPTVLVVEDLHWIDPSTLEVLGLVVEEAPSARLLVIGTLRPEAELAFAARSHVVKLPLGRLSPSEVRSLLMGIAGKPLPPELVEQLLQSSDGMPLFVEESTKMMLECGALAEGTDAYTLAGSLPAALAPATLQGSLMARLDRLGTVKETAQRAAVIGRELSFALLREISPGDPGALEAELRQLVDAGLLLQRGRLPEATYLFKHALMQDTAYRSLPRRRQQQMHHDVARAYEQHFPAAVATQPELLAHHFTEAGLAASAVGYWIRGGQRAFERSAHVEAGSHFGRALQLLGGLPATPERDQRERAVQVALGASLMATQGYAGPDVARAYDRARELADRGGDAREQFAALRGTWLYYSARGAFDTAAELAQPMRALAEGAADPGLILQAMYPCGVTAFHRGELDVAARDLQHALSLYDREEQRRLPQRYGLVDPGVGALGYVGALAWMTGHADEALARAEEAVALAQDLRQPFSVAYASLCVAWVHQLRGEPEAVLTWAERTIEVATRERYPFWLRLAMMPRAWARAFQDGGAPAFAEVISALAGYRATGAELLRTPQTAAAAELCVRIGKPDEGLALAAEGLDVAVAQGERFFRAELLRVRGELLLAGGAEAAAEAAFLEARDEARRRGALALELRAATSLGALERRRAPAGPATEALAELLRSFTEGHETADLRRARALLDRA